MSNISEVNLFMNKTSNNETENSKCAEKLKSYVPYEIQNSYIFKEIFNAYGESFDKLKIDISDLFLQILPQTATEWGVSLWEKRIGIPNNTSKTLEERRAGILAKLINKSIATIEVIENVARSFVNDDKVQVIEDNLNYSFIVDFNSDKVKNLYYIENAINEIKPAHLNYSISITDEKRLKLEAKYNEYYYEYFMCGTFVCGTKPYII